MSDEKFDRWFQLKENDAWVIKGMLANGGAPAMIARVFHAQQSEVDAIADRVVVLRDGKNAGELQRSEIEHEAMVRMMIGRDIARFHQRSSRRDLAGESVQEAAQDHWADCS